MELKKEFVAGIVISFVLGWFTASYFSDVPVLNHDATIEQDTLIIRVKNEAKFKPTGEIRIFDENDEEIFRHTGLNAQEEDTISLPLSVELVNITLNKTGDFSFKVPFFATSQLNRIPYQIGCERCLHPVTFGWIHTAQLKAFNASFACTGTDIGLPNCTTAEIPVYSLKSS